MKLSDSALLFLLARVQVGAFFVKHPVTRLDTPTRRAQSVVFRSLSESDDQDERETEKKSTIDTERRDIFSASMLTAGSILASSQPAHAGNYRSRTDGYSYQKTDEEWNAKLSDMQYYILRRGGTESPNSSILEGEDRPGVFSCAGCGTDLFESSQKFHSGTGWPSFARGLKGVEVEDVNPLAAGLVGAELRCKTCGGHLGDVFGDGFLFVGTPAFTSGKRYCIDGAALIFHPAQEGEPDVSGDVAPPKKSAPGWFDPPKINAQ